MNPLPLREFHKRLNGHFTEVNGMEVVDYYGDPLAEHATLRQAAGVLDLSFRSRLCLLGADRQKYLNGQVTNNVKDLKTGEGCYAALVNAKGKMQSDLNLYLLENEILLDFEPGYSAAVAQRLEKYIIADDVQVTDVAPHYGLLSVQGPKAAEVVKTLEFEVTDPQATPDPSRDGNKQTASAAPRPRRNWGRVRARQSPAAAKVDELRFTKGRCARRNLLDESVAHRNYRFRFVRSTDVPRRRRGQTHCRGEGGWRSRLRMAGVGNGAHRSRNPALWSRYG